MADEQGQGAFNAQGVTASAPGSVAWVSEFQEKRRISGPLKRGVLITAYVIFLITFGAELDQVFSLRASLPMVFRILVALIVAAINLSLFVGLVVGPGSLILAGIAWWRLRFLEMRMFCPFCEAFISSHDAWRCGRCGQENRGEQDSFLFRCGKCRSSPDTYRCPTCHRLLYLTDKKVGQAEDPVGATCVGYKPPAPKVPVVKTQPPPRRETPEDPVKVMTRAAEEEIRLAKSRIEGIVAINKAREETFRRFKLPLSEVQGLPEELQRQWNAVDEVYRDAMQSLEKRFKE
jgi:hypothetical protein